jgi:hypothetical protein
MKPTGLPHSGIDGASPACGPPSLFAACRALHRPLSPRHPPHTGSRLRTPVLDLRQNSDHIPRDLSCTIVRYSTVKVRPPQGGKGKYIIPFAVWRKTPARAVSMTVCRRPWPLRSEERGRGTSTRTDRWAPRGTRLVDETMLVPDTHVLSPEQGARPGTGWRLAPPPLSLERR